MDRFEQIINIRKQLREIYKKEQLSKMNKSEFVIPSPSQGEDENTYISRCISEVVGEYDAEGQAYAVCKGKWDEK